MMVPDYYVMLGVEPTADRATIEAALARSQPAWSSGTRNPKNKHTFQSYLDQIPEIRRALLGEASARAAYDAELSAARHAERERTLDELQRLVRLRAARGGLSVGDRALLRDRAAGLGLAPADVDRLAEAFAPLPEGPADPADEPDPPADLLDPVTRRQIGVALDHLRRRDLYDALGLPHDAPADEIAERADAERRRWMQKTQVTAEKTAWLEVVSLAQSHLGSAPSRARYDRTLEADREDTFLAAVEFAVEGRPRLDAGTRAALAEEASALGISPPRSARLIDRVCRKKGVTVEGGASPAGGAPPPRLLRCRSCSGLTEFGTGTKSQGPDGCRHCRASLRWDCPSCQKPHWVDEPKCACGFRLEHLGPFLRHFEAAQDAFRSRRYDDAEAHLESARRFAPNHVGARKGIERIHGRLAEVERARSEFQTARAAGRLVAAGDALAAWGRLVDPTEGEWKEAHAEVYRGLRDAHALASQARSLESKDPKAARTFYRNALERCADLAEAQEGLRRCPPDPPANLQADFAEGRVRLRWAPPPPDGLGPLSFVVLRKADAPFQHIADGTRVAEVSAAEYDDAQVEAGQMLSYAVLSRRGGAESIHGVSVGPIALLAEPGGLRAESGDGEVHLSWTLPPGAREARVVRRRGSVPKAPDDGTWVESLRDHAHERGLENDHVYHYGVFAIYQLPDGRLVPSRAATVSAQPHAPIPAIGAPTLAQERDGRVRLSWPPPGRGTVKILRTGRALGLAPGDNLDASAAEALGGTWLEVIAPDHAIDPDPPAVGVCHYTPMTAWAGTLTLGAGVAYSCVPDPTDLRATRVGHGGRINLRWRWSGQGSQSLVVAKAGEPPLGPDDPDALISAVHEGEYSRQGHWSLALPAADGLPWHVCVYSVASIEGEPVVSPGLEPSARIVVPGPNPEVTVSYTFRKPRLTSKSWSLTFRTEPPGAAIPPTALVTHPRTVPLTADDGEILAQFPAAHDGATFSLRDEIDLRRLRARIFADPRADPGSLPPIRIRHPEAEVARL